MHSSWILLTALTSVLLPGLHGHSLTKRQEEGNGQQPEAREVAPGIYSYTTGGRYISMFIVEDEVWNIRAFPFSVCHRQERDNDFRA